MSKVTNAQRRFKQTFQGHLPNQPYRGKFADRNYGMMVDHLMHNQTYEGISYPYQLTRERTRQIVERGLELAEASR